MQRSSRRRQLESSSDEFMDDEPSTSRAKSKTNKSSNKRSTKASNSDSNSDSDQEETVHGFTATEIAQISNNIAKYILSNSISKFPIKRLDVVKNVLNGK